MLKYLNMNALEGNIGVLIEANKQLRPKNTLNISGSSCKRASSNTRISHEALSHFGFRSLFFTSVYLCSSPHTTSTTLYY